MNNYQEKMEKLYYYAEAWETSIGEVIKMKKNELFMSLVCADINNCKLYVTSYTAKMAKQMGHPAATLLAQYKAMYPTYKVIVDAVDVRQACWRGRNARRNH